MHLGHYFSVIKPAVELGADVLVAEYHAPKATEDEVEEMYLALQEFGVASDHIHLQSKEFDPGLYFRLLSIARVGELERMTQYMSSAGKHIDGVPAGNDAHLLVYPVLMVHDVMGYEEILVGEDQAQHLNYARDLIERYNRKFDETSPLPVARLVGGRVMSLNDPSKKMSKSEPDGCLFLDDTPEETERKIRAAVTDTEGRANLINIYTALGGTWEVPLMNSVFKPMVVNLLIEKLQQHCKVV